MFIFKKTIVQTTEKMNMSEDYKDLRIKVNFTALKLFIQKSLTNSKINGASFR